MPLHALHFFPRVTLQTTEIVLINSFRAVEI